MNPGAGVFLRIDREVRGPCEREAVRRLIENGVVTWETEVASTADGPWAAAETVPEVAAMLPPRRVLGFKAKEFDVINAGGAPAVDWREIAVAKQPEGRVLRPSHPAELTSHLATKAAAPLNEVEAMVREVQAREAQFAPPPPPPPKWRPGRRLKFGLVLALVGNAVLVAIPLSYGMWQDSWTMLIMRGWFVLYNLGVVIICLSMPRN